MRIIALLLGTSMLAACGSDGGGGIASGGTVAPATPTTPASNHTFVNPTVEKTYAAIGSSHSYQYKVDPKISSLPGSTAEVSDQYGQLYQGNASTVRQGGLTISYNPRDAIFNLSLSDTKAGTNLTTRFQDPAHRTDFGGLNEPQPNTPQLTLPGIQYLQAASTNGGTQGGMTYGGTNSLPVMVSDPTITSGAYNQDTFFYQKPGTTTKYVTFAGYLRNGVTATRETATVVPATPTTPAVTETTTKYNYSLSRGAYVFGENTSIAEVPKTGSGTYNGHMLATSVLNDRIDTNFDAPTYFQWIEGAASAKVDFGANLFTLDLNGNVFAPQVDITNSDSYSVRSGATFTANGSGRLDLTYTGGFLGAFQKAWFVNPGGSRIDLFIAGSSIDGAFYGPKAEEVGGSFRIVGGTPDERIDILGVFTGK